MGNGFWADISTEPKRKYRWLLLLGGVPSWLVKTTGKPGFEVTETEHQYLNHTFYYPGRVQWQEISVTLVDPVTPDASKTLENILQQSGYNFPTNPNDTTTISKSKAVAALGNVAIIQVGADNNEEIERWELKNPWVKSVKFGDLDYSSDDMVEIELTIRYDYAQIVTSKDQGVEPANR